ncbi:Bug family tripartite tricarboxylate transporter substrate binding protein [Pseudorhodoferax sp.]|uniref:Bug family tripartite tricarboxylate transporter substrate binding protein n=1 Tax=Pseudorhodoferax sp. TaxID=1993553 RepID=UPI002DD678A5|nr:tripartite tricarboxylate transporter substrate binding protein [Pseudorhodoferax sp.]
MPLLPLSPLSRRHLLRTGCAALALLTTPAWAAYPDKPVRITVGFAAGGAADIVARQLGAKLGDQTGQQFLVDNKAGATGTIAATGVARSPADGYNVMLASQSTMVVAPGMYNKLNYDPVKDFIPVTQLVSMPLVLVVHPSVPAKTVAELLALSKKGPVTYASSGLGGPQHIAGELFKYLGKVDWTHVPYKGEAPAVADVIGGQVQVAFINLPVAQPHIVSGKLRALAVSSARRHAGVPDLPTVAEAGSLPDFDVQTWYGLFAPSGTPADVVARLQAESSKALQSPDLSAKLLEQGYTLLGTGTAAFTQFVRTEVPRWGKIIRDANIRAE